MQKWTNVEVVIKAKLFFQALLRPLLLQCNDGLLNRAMEKLAWVEGADGLQLFGRRGQSTEARNQSWNLWPQG